MPKSLARQHHNAYPSSRYGTTQSNYSQERRLPSWEDSSRSHKKNMKKREKLSKNISSEEQFACRNPPTAPTSSMSERRTRSFDPSKTTDLSINGRRRIEMSPL